MLLKLQLTVFQLLFWQELFKVADSVPQEEKKYFDPCPVKLWTKSDKSWIR